MRRAFEEMVHLLYVQQKALRTTKEEVDRGRYIRTSNKLMNMPIIIIQNITHIQCKLQYMPLI